MQWTSTAYPDLLSPMFKSKQLLPKQLLTTLTMTQMQSEHKSTLEPT